MFEKLGKFKNSEKFEKFGKFEKLKNLKIEQTYKMAKETRVIDDLISNCAKVKKTLEIK